MKNVRHSLVIVENLSLLKTLIIDTTLMKIILKQNFETETMDQITGCNVVVGILVILILV